jgi:CrcB protein
MSATTLLLVGAVGGLGALSRFLVDGGVSARSGIDLPVGTLAVNLSGAFLLGLVSGALAAGTTRTILGVGFIGAYTTFSTWMLESHRLAEEGQGRVAALNLALSLVLGLAVAWLGLKLGATIG